MDNATNTGSFNLKSTLVDALARQADGGTLPAGTVLGAYQVIALLGQGGMGEVYRVMQQAACAHAGRASTRTCRKSAAHASALVPLSRVFTDFASACCESTRDLHSFPIFRR
jgi:hypothetical protein